MNCLKLTSIVGLTSAMLVFFVTGCANHAERGKIIEHQQLLEIEKRRLQTSFPAEIVYQGSKNGYDHFTVYLVSLSNTRKPYHYRIPQDACPIRERFPLYSDTKRYSPMQAQSGNAHFKVWEPSPVYAPLPTNFDGFFTKPLSVEPR
jgi:hypothetical protein